MFDSEWKRNHLNWVCRPVLGIGSKKITNPSAYRRPQKQEIFIFLSWKLDVLHGEWEDMHCYLSVFIKNFNFLFQCKSFNSWSSNLGFGSGAEFARQLESGFHENEFETSDKCKFAIECSRLSYTSPPPHYTALWRQVQLKALRYAALVCKFDCAFTSSSLVFKSQKTDHELGGKIGME